MTLLGINTVKFFHNFRLITRIKEGKIPIKLKNFFCFKFLEDISLFVWSLIPLFWTSGDISSGFHSQSGQPYSRRM